jgi:hypothetical protein
VRGLPPAHWFPEYLTSFTLIGGDVIDLGGGGGGYEGSYGLGLNDGGGG